MRVLYGTVFLAVLATVLVRCRDATQMIVEVTTDLPCEQHGGTAIVVGKLGALDTGTPTTAGTTCKSGKVGTLVIVPSGSDDGDIAFQITTGIGIDPATCGAGTTPASCIVARRGLRFLPHETLRLRVPMKQRCAGISCDPQSTCFDGRCVSAQIDPGRCTGAGCGEDALVSGNVPADGGVADADADADAADGAVPPAQPPLRQVAIGQDHACAIVRGGVQCWGRNDNGQLGNGTVSNGANPTPGAVVGFPPLAVVVAVASSNDTTGALTESGEVYLWGENFHQQIPDAPSSVPRARRVDVSPMGRICVGHDHACGITRDRKTLTCWGADHDTTDRAPAAIDLGAEATTIGCGDHLTIVQMGDGTVRTAGQSRAGLGRPGGVAGSTPVAVSAVGDVTALSSGWFDTVATQGDGGVLGWGENQAQTLGGPGAQPAPIALGVYRGLSSIGVGIRFACGLMGAQAVCWGTNEFGQHGPNGGADTPVPVVIAGLPAPVVGVWANGNHACASAGAPAALYCWGANDYGQVGAPADPGIDHPIPARVPLR